MDVSSIVDVLFKLGDWAGALLSIIAMAIIVMARKSFISRTEFEAFQQTHRAELKAVSDRFAEIAVREERILGAIEHLPKGDDLRTLAVELANSRGELAAVKVDLEWLRKHSDLMTEGHLVIGGGDK